MTTMNSIKFFKRKDLTPLEIQFSNAVNDVANLNPDIKNVVKDLYIASVKDLSP